MTERGNQIHAELPKAEYAAFRALCKEQDLSVTQLVRRLIRAELVREVAEKDANRGEANRKEVSTLSVQRQEGSSTRIAL
ncbi:ribbon-helix-helix protein, CopG family [Paraburkholderia caribensis]|uniref:ribbon-helix-helix protein, CopG family n=1 Tax=Paraburkholderia caribensis TaxID=75105 RepID=UPI002090BE45|nr:ribbon-helix-helix protein, CopG family [Paraburkholderia caribensis]MCO4880253.1 hypothetical protein [Paraburkholderia caribensis]